MGRKIDLIKNPVPNGTEHNITIEFSTHIPSLAGFFCYCNKNIEVVFLTDILFLEFK